MQRASDLLLTLLIGLLVCAGVIIFRPAWWSAIESNVAGAFSKSRPPIAAELQNPFAKSEPKAPAKGHRTPKRESAEVVRTVSSVVTAPAEARFPFPIETDIPSGTPKSRLLGAFGSPQFRVTGTDVGSLQEQLVYLDRDSGQKTVILLVNGKVSSAQTSAQ